MARMNSTIAIDNIYNVEDAPATPDETVTIDSVVPQSVVDQAALGNELSASVFEIPYVTTDSLKNGFASGAKTIRLFASKTSATGPFEEYTQTGPWNAGDTILFYTEATGLTFGGPGVYYFYTLVTDNAGNEEAVKATADATVKIMTIGSSVDDWMKYDCSR